MIRTQISLEPQAYRDAKAEARRQGISLAELLRRAIDRTVVRQTGTGRSWMRYAGALSSGDAAASRSVNEVVYGRRRP